MTSSSVNQPSNATDSAPGTINTSLTVGPTGPIVLGDTILLDTLGEFVRERIPERVVHARGSGAHGVFEVTHDISKFCKAKLFSAVGKSVPVFVRFSTVTGEKGSNEVVRDPRGFAIKFYTEDGNWDLVANNTPVFFVRDGMKFPDFVHSQKRNPVTNLPDPNSSWEFFSRSPESAHQLLILYSDRGIPKGYRRMHGFGGHSFRMVNHDSEVFYIKFHLITKQGIDCLTTAQAATLSGSDTDYFSRDLRTSIDGGEYPVWTMYIQIMPFNQAKTYVWDVFDITKVWPHSDFPLIEVGVLTLNRNPDDFFSEVEQAAFCPGNLIRGIEPSEDKLLQARLFSYRDAQRYRLGSNHNLLPVNKSLATCAKSRTAGQNTFQSSLSACPYMGAGNLQGGMVARHQVKISPSDFIQPGKLYREVLQLPERERLVQNIALTLSQANLDIQIKQVEIFTRCDVGLGSRLADALGLPESVVVPLNLSKY